MTINIVNSQIVKLNYDKSNYNNCKPQNNKIRKITAIN